MKQYLALAVALVVAFLIAGCAGNQIKSDGIATLEERLDKENERQNERIKAIDTYISIMKDRSIGASERQELINRIAVLESKVQDLERKDLPSMGSVGDGDIEGIKERKTNHGQVPLRIKVLSGDGSPTSAKRMAIKLGRYGYNVERTDIANKRNYKKTAIFYSEGNRKHAAEIFRKIGGNADLKPLTWQSVFDIIIVTGRP
jgi:hypothetical protein